VECSREQALGKPVEQLITGEHAVARLGRKALSRATGFAESGQKIERRSGEDALVDVAATPLFGPEGDVDGVVLAVRDRSARNRLELLEQEKERFDAFGLIAAGLAHEVKNPLGGIRGAGEILSRRSQDPKTQEIAGLVVTEATRIASLVDDFMVFARGDRLALDVINVHQILDHVVGLTQMDTSMAPLVTERSFDPSIPDLIADRDRLIQVFLNLIRNARQAMEPGGGKLTLETRVALDHRLVTAEGGSIPTLSIRLLDTGVGMDEEELRQARTPFYTTSTGGTGLGLALAEYWIAQHEGTLHIDSTKGEGTQVRVALPIRRKSQ